MFEYLIVDPGPQTRDAITSILNQYGADRWEHYMSDVRGNLYLKREKSLELKPSIANFDAATVSEQIAPKPAATFQPPSKQSFTPRSRR